MRQLDLFGFDTEPQQAAPQQKKTVTVLPATPPLPSPSPAPDNTTLIFADNKIGIKIKLKREIPLTGDITAPADVPKTEEAEVVEEPQGAEPVALQITLEEAILAATADETEAPAEVAEPIVTINADVASEVVAAAVEVPETSVISESIVEEQLMTPAQQEPEMPAVTAEISIVAQEVIPNVEAAQSMLVKPAIISVEEELEEGQPQDAEPDTLPVAAATVIADEPEPVIAMGDEAVETAPVATTELSEVATEVPEAATQMPAAVAEEVVTLPSTVAEAVPAPDVPAVPEQEAPAPVLLTRPLLAKPAIIEIEEDIIATAAVELPVAAVEMPEAGQAPETAATADATDMDMPEAVAMPEATIVTTKAIAEPELSAEADIAPEAVAAVAEPVVEVVSETTSEVMAAAITPAAPRARIKAPKPVKEPAAPKKRGRKSFKEIDAETDLIQLPDDEALFEKQYYPISVVAGWFNVNASLLRFWENEFDILKPRKNRKGDRLFRPEDVKNLQVIYYLLRQRKFTIEGAKEYLKTNKKKADTNTQMIQSLTKLRSFLLEFKANLLG